MKINSIHGPTYVLPSIDNYSGSDCSTLTVTVYNVSHGATLSRQLKEERWGCEIKIRKNSKFLGQSGGCKQGEKVRSLVRLRHAMQAATYYMGLHHSQIWKWYMDEGFLCIVIQEKRMKMCITPVVKKVLHSTLSDVSVPHSSPSSCRENLVQR